MAKYHVGIGIMGIFAGTITKTNKWINRSDVTDEALRAVAQFLLEHKQAMEFSYHDKRYLLSVNPVKNETQESKDKDVKQKKYDCCRDCKYLSNTKSSIGYLCEHPAKHFRTGISCWKPKATKACKQFERGVYNG